MKQRKSSSAYAMVEKDVDEVAENIKENLPAGRGPMDLFRFISIRMKR